MAGIFRGQGSRVAHALLLALLFVVFASPAALAQLYEQPELIVDPGKHTAPIKDVGVDTAGRIAVTGGFDKTLRVWSLSDGHLLRTIRVPSGPGNIGKVYAVAVNPDGALVAAGGWTQWTTSAPEDSIYLFETLTGKMTARIARLPASTFSLAFSPDGRYLAAGLGGKGGLRVYDRQKHWREVFRDTDYGEQIDGVTFSADGRLAATSYDGKVRLYDVDFRLVVPPKQVTGGREPYRASFSPDGTLLAVGYNDRPTVDVLDGRSLAPLPGPDLEGLSKGSLLIVTWSKDGETLYAGGALNHLLAWANAGRGARRALPAGSDATSGLTALTDDQLLVVSQDPFLELLERDGRLRWSHASPQADFRNDQLRVSADGTVVDFGFEEFGKSPLRFDLRALKLTSDPPSDRQAIPPKITGLAVGAWKNDRSPTLDGKPIELSRYETSRSLSIAPDSSRFVLGSEWTLRAFNAKGNSELRRGWLGVHDQPVTDEIADSLNVHPTRGVLITSVVDNGPAKRAGIELRDVVVKLDGKDIKEPNDLSRIVADSTVGKEVEVVVIRNGQEETHKVTLGERENTDKVRPIWQRAAPAAIWAVNISGDGRLVVAAYGDGTIRWHRMDDGRELLALYVLADKQNWVAWTPEGFYGATPGAFGVLQWQVNRGFDAAADTVPVNEIPRLRRPDALPLVLQEMETARALGIADLKAARSEVQTITRAKLAPGAQLFVLTIGIKDYGDKAKDLELEFADHDARDVANALVNTQEGGLYARVIPQFLSNETATKGGIFDALTAMERDMAGSSGQDLALVMFSGHGTMIDDQLYLVPNGADDSTPGRLKASAIPATEFQDEIAKLAKHGRVLVLLDTCHSAGLIGALPASNALKSALAVSNVTVLTSTKTTDRLSKEYEKWGHGVFTKVLLDALSASDDVDTNHDGVISMSELTAYMEKRLENLTGGDQQLGLDQRFQGDIFVAGL